jgi:predicted transcriptional regulator of viral defense system
MIFEEEYMRSERLIRILEESKSSIFSLSDIVKVLNKDEKYVKVLLNRLVKKGFLIRIERNKYSLPNQNPFSIASLLVFPSYISFISAYSYYNLTTQIPSTIFTVSLKQKKRIIYSGYEIRFVKFSRERFFGYLREYIESKAVFIAEIEKAILDSLFLPKYCPLSETFLVLKEAKLNYEKLLEYVKKFNSMIVAKRLGYLLESTGIDLYDSLKSLIDKNYEVFNPLKLSVGKKNEKWRLIINEVLE